MDGKSAYRPLEAVKGGKGLSDTSRDAAAAAEAGASTMKDPTTQEEYEATIRDSLSAIDKQHAPIQNVEKRIHIVGTGSIGKLVAHSLRGIPDPPPVTLLFHRYKLLEKWRKGKQEIVVQDGEFEVPRGGFDCELQPVGQSQHGVDVPHGTPDVFDLSDRTGVKPHEVAKIVTEHRTENEESRRYSPIQPTEQSSEPIVNKAAAFLPDDIIHNLIVCTKTIRTVVALSRLKHRLNAQSTICFLQNGMGVIDDVNAELFPDPATRPNYVQGIITHGANSPPEKAESNPFYVVHAGHGTISLGIVPREPVADPEAPAAPPASEIEEDLDDDFVPDSDSKPDTPKAQLGHLPEHYPQSARYLIRTLTRTPVLAAVAHTPHELLQLQLEKLAVNSILNPLTSLIDARNGTILHNHELTRTFRLMLAETSLIIRTIPELRGLPNTNTRFSAARLERLVIEVARKTKDNISSMLADVRAGRKTEVGYINGYIVKRGEELGIKAVVNYAMMCAVQGKRRVVQREREGEVPVLGSRDGLNIDL